MPLTDFQGRLYFKISVRNNVYATVNRFQDKTRVHIRTYEPKPYRDDTTKTIFLPTRKGVQQHQQGAANKACQGEDQVGESSEVGLQKRPSDVSLDQGIRIIKDQYLPLNKEPPAHAARAFYIRWTNELSPTPEPAAEEEELWE
nr:hypothetical protein BaRGS_021679 [Batillaria attramentaria]